MCLNRMNLTLQEHIHKFLDWVSNAIYAEIIIICFCPLQSSPLSMFIDIDLFMFIWSTVGTVKGHEI